MEKAAEQPRPLFWCKNVYIWFCFCNVASAFWDLKTSRIVAQLCSSFTLTFHGQKHRMRETSTLVQGPSMKQCGTLIGANSSSMRRRTIKLLQWIEHETACRNSSATCSPNGGPPKEGTHCVPVTVPVTEGTLENKAF